jgi:N-acetylmuramoyl-L-alanine amidase
VVLDPGHNGGRSASLNDQVPAGRGKTKPCNTGGTSTDAGYPEHAFTWDVVQRVQKRLRAEGVRVVLTRNSDHGIGPCVNKRAATGNNAHADAVVSVHADGNTGAGNRGFHVIRSSPPVNAAQGTPSMTLARDMRGAFVGEGFPTSNYLGHDGLDARDDLAGLNLSTRPAVMIECGNMRNAKDSALITSAAGRQRYADAVTAGIEAFLRAQ